MVTAAELLGTTTDMIFIDVVSRTIKIPKNLTLLGVTSDEDVQKLRFTMSRHYNGIDLSTHTIRINYENAQGEGDVFTAVEKKVTTDTIEFTWIVSRHATMYSGNVKFTVCAIRTDADSNRISEFNTVPATLPVAEGLETDQAEVMEEYPDAIAAAAVEALAKAKENGDFTPVKGEDYYTPEEAAEFGQMVVDNAHGQFANAIKGVKSGEVVRVDDVSPIEHVVDCWVHGKNLLNDTYFKIESQTKNGVTCTPNNDGTYTISGEHTSTGFTTFSSNKITNYEEAPSIPPGTYTPTPGVTVVCRDVVTGKESNIQQTFTTDTPFKVVAWYCYISPNGSILGGTYTNLPATVYPQLEAGPVATTYEPYIDPATVTVTACGKNILEVTGKTTTQAGVTFTVNSNGSITVNGTATENTFYKVGKINLANCGQYYVSGSPTNSGVTTSLLYIHDVESYADVYDYGNGRAFTPTGGTCDVVIGVYKGYTANNLVYWPMVEAGTERTEFEKFTKKLTYNPGTDGKCSVVSVSPTMTVFTDTPGVIVEAEYSRDTTKMFESYVLTDRVIGAIAAEIEDDMVEVLEDLNDYAESFGSGDGEAVGVRKWKQIANTVLEAEGNVIVEHEKYFDEFDLQIDTLNVSTENIAGGTLTLDARSKNLSVNESFTGLYTKGSRSRVLRFRGKLENGVWEVMTYNKLNSWQSTDIQRTGTLANDQNTITEPIYRLSVSPYQSTFPVGTHFKMFVKEVNS